MSREQEDSIKVKKPKRVMHPNSIANLITYPKGVSGNAGSGKGYSLTAELKHALDKETRARLIQSTIQGAIDREPTPFREVWDRVDGRLQDKQGGDNIINPVYIQLLERLRGNQVKELGEKDAIE